MKTLIWTRYLHTAIKKTKQSIVKIRRRYLKNVSVEAEYGKPHVEFTQDGVLKSAELKIMNLRPGANLQLVWEEVIDFSCISFRLYFSCRTRLLSLCARNLSTFIFLIHVYTRRVYVIRPILLWYISRMANVGLVKIEISGFFFFFFSCEKAYKMSED